MKNIFKLFLLCLAGGVFFTACDTEEAPFSELNPEGAILSITDVQTGFYDLTNTANASIGFSVVSAGEAVGSVDLYKAYNGGTPVLHSTLSSLPSSLNVSLADAVSGLGVTVDEVGVGDVFTFSFGEYTAGAGTYKSGTTLDVAASCPSSLAGDYTASTTGSSTDDCCPDVTTVEGTTVTISGEDGAYTVNDFSAGLYLEWYATYGITDVMSTDGSLEISFTDVCGTLSGTGSEPFDTDVTLTGSVDSDTGVITYTWSNGYNDEATVTLTPQ